MESPANKNAPGIIIAFPQGGGRLDKVGIALSGICMLHCLALPLGLTLLPVTGTALPSEQAFHLLMLAFILPVSIIALSIGCHKHRDLAALLLGTVGLGTLIFTASWGHQVFGLAGERVATAAGGLILALAHMRNYRACRQHRCDHAP